MSTKLCCLLNPTLSCEACGLKVCVGDYNYKAGRWMTWQYHLYVKQEGVSETDVSTSIYLCPLTKKEVVAYNPSRGYTIFRIA